MSFDNIEIVPDTWIPEESIIKVIGVGGGGCNAVNYMYRQKNTVGNYENVGFALPGHEGLYNIYMMEEIHSIFAAGAGAVTKLVDNTGAYGKSANIERLFAHKYPKEYLEESKDDLFEEKVLGFYQNHNML